MATIGTNTSQWPELNWDQWKDTSDTLCREWDRASLDRAEVVI